MVADAQEREREIIADADGSHQEGERTLQTFAAAVGDRSTYYSQTCSITRIECKKRTKVRSIGMEVIIHNTKSTICPLPK